MQSGWNPFSLCKRPRDCKESWIVTWLKNTSRRDGYEKATQNGVNKGPPSPRPRKEPEILKQSSLAIKVHYFDDSFYQSLYIDGPYINNLYGRVGSNSKNVYILLKSLVNY